jgi:hypothetical protein
MAKPSPPTASMVPASLVGDALWRADVELGVDADLSGGDIPLCRRSPGHVEAIELVTDALDDSGLDRTGQRLVEVEGRHVHLEFSGAGTRSPEPYPFPDIWDPLARVFDTWGFERCLWGADWTRASAVVNYEQAVEPFRQTDRLSDSERAMLMGGACARSYGWSPKKGSLR